MNYQSRNSSGRGRMSRYSNAIKIALGAAVIVAIFSLFAPRILSGFFSAIFSPLWHIVDDSRSSRVAALQEQLESFAAASSTIALLEQENGELKAMLGRPPAKNSILAVVLKKPPFADYDNLIIDVGADRGVQVGNVVYALSTLDATAVTIPANDGTSTLAASSTNIDNVKVPIGSIVEVDPTTSKVDLYSSPDEKYNVEIGPKHIAITATGRGSGGFQAILPREAGIAVGDLVTVPSIQPLVFSTVTDILSDPARPYATVLFQSPVNVFTLHWVEVEIKPAAPVIASTTHASH